MSDTDTTTTTTTDDPKPLSKTAWDKLIDAATKLAGSLAGDVLAANVKLSMHLASVRDSFKWQGLTPADFTTWAIEATGLGSNQIDVYLRAAPVASTIDSDRFPKVSVGSLSKLSQVAAEDRDKVLASLTSTSERNVFEAVDAYKASSGNGSNTGTDVRKVNQRKRDAAAKAVRDKVNRALSKAEGAGISPAVAAELLSLGATLAISVKGNPQVPSAISAIGKEYVKDAAASAAAANLAA